MVYTDFYDTLFMALIVVSFIARIPLAAHDATACR